MSKVVFRSLRKLKFPKCLLIIALNIFLPLTNASAGILLQGFYWDAPSSWNESWWDKLASQSNSLAKSGITAVWIPPVLKGASGGYSNGYDPYDDYDLGSKDQRGTYGTRWGTREQLMRMVAVMRANGISVYFDNVLGHRNGESSCGNFLYKDAFNQQGGGRFAKSGFDFSGYNSFGRQVNHDSPYMRSGLIEAGDWLTRALGVQGQRIDMATHVSPNFLNEYLNSGAMQSHFAVSEYWSENLDELERYVLHDMHGRISAFDFPLWGRLKDLAHSGGLYDLRQLITAGLNSRQPNLAVTFVENHDTDRSYPTIQNKHLAYAYILTTEGYPSVFWKDYFEYGLKDILDPLIWIHEKFAYGATNWRFTKEDLLIFERESQPGLLVGITNNQSADQSQWVQTNFGSFVTLHDYTGNAPDITTEADGRVEVRVPKNSYVAYSVKGFHWPHSVDSHRTQQQFAGSNDLDIPAASSWHYKTVGRIFIAGGTTLNLNLNVQGLQNGESVQLETHSPNGPINSFSSHTTEYNQGVQIEHTGWYEFKIKLFSQREKSNNVERFLDYWLNVDYQAPTQI